MIRVEREDWSAFRVPIPFRSSLSNSVDPILEEIAEFIFSVA